MKESGSVVHRVIDLVFKEESEWVIVDYKTDDFERDIMRGRRHTRSRWSCIRSVGRG